MQEKIKIIHIITRLDKGGSAENVLITCEKLNKEKYEPILVHGGSQPLRVRYESDCHHLPFTIYHLPSLSREISPVKDIIAFWKIYKIIKKEKPDIVHTHSSKAGFLGRWATRLYRFTHLPSTVYHLPKIIHTPHGHIFYGYYGKTKSYLFILLERLTAMITDKLVALTEGEKNESLSFGVGKPEQWTVIHSGVEKLEVRSEKLEVRKKLNIPENAIVIGTVARLEPIKGVKYFIDAIPIVVTSYRAYFGQFIETENKPDKSGNYIFLIVGDGSEKQKLEARSQKLGIKDKIIFTGFREDVSDLISIIDIYVQPSLNEGMGKTIVQAEMLGKPVVATRVQGIPDVVIEDKTGILVPPKNPEALADAIVKLIHHSDLRDKFGKEGEKIAKNFSVENMIEKISKVYEDLIDNR